MTGLDLAAIATGRTTDLFGPDIAGRREEIADRVEGGRFLLVGGAGSIGTATLKALLEFSPAALHVVDQNENALAELIRDLRSRPRGLAVREFRCLPLDFGSPIMERFLRDQCPYDGVLSFAAIKHVRSEKDAYSILQMLETNVLKHARLLGWLEDGRAPSRFFAVSTDKAANPVNLMGASKRLMEEVIFSVGAQPGGRPAVTSARFANVAFSEGSLLQSFQRRLEKRQPLAVPKDTKRYFISLREAGQICLLASACAPAGHLLVPRLSPESDLRSLDEIAARFLRHQGYEPRLYEEEAAARAAVESDAKAGCYPLLLTPLDTSGEKPFEEFVGEGERVTELGLPNLLSIEARPASAETAAAFLRRIEECIGAVDRSTNRDWLVDEVRKAVPSFHHTDSTKSLDDRI